MPSDTLQPFQWPSEWTDPALLGLIAGSPINCLLLDTPESLGAVAAAARNTGVTVLDWKSLSATPLAEVKWNAPASQHVITGLVWPRIKLSPAGRSAAVEAGPTGAPWIDSNAWVAHLARVRGRGAPLWLSFEPDKDAPTPDTTAYNIAIADSAAAGARWIVSLDQQLRRGLAAGNGDAVQTWRNLLAMLAFFEQHRKWSAWEPWGALGILSAFAGEYEFLGQEVLNLAARRNLHYRVLDRSATPGRPLEQLRAVLCVDAAAPTPEWKAALTGFARSGGLLIVPRALAAQFPGATASPSPVAGYSVRTLGRGKVAAAARDWDDPYFLAQEVHSLVSRGHDPVRLFNASSLWEHYAESPDARSAVLQLVGFSNRPYPSVSIVPARPWRTASLYVPGDGKPAVLEPVKVDGKSYFAALEYGL
ncbi:MAG: hypothetical protein NTW28_27290 [Candidatus Solibacter sp.]|nr:hypothetical protein [Candidatus Solibacter sp.]